VDRDSWIVNRKDTIHDLGGSTVAEATDRAGEGGEGSSGAAAKPVEHGITAWPDMTSVAPSHGTSGEGAGESYRPLSLLALAGFALAAIYALIVVLGGAVSLFNRIPWLLSPWTFVFPLAALIVCLVARARIRNSEATLSGLTFTTWGIRLTIILALSYAAYYSFAYFAVRLQAIDCANGYFEQIKQGRIHRAYLQGMVESPKLTNDDDLRELIEATHNAPMGRNMRPGQFSQFRHTEYVRLIEMAGDEAKITPQGVVDWNYENGGYKVTLRYQVATPLAEFDMIVKTFGRDSKPGEPKGRRWGVIIAPSETQIVQTTMNLTPTGQEFMKSAVSAREFLARWVKRITDQQLDQVYLDTQRPAERERLSKGRQTARFLSSAPLTGLGALGLCDADCRRFLAGWQAFLNGKTIQTDDKTFWTSKKERNAILERVRQTFQPGPQGQPTFALQPEQVNVPLQRIADGEKTILFDFQVIYLDEKSPMPKYVAEGFVAVSAPEQDADGSPAWRIRFIELSNAHTASMMMPPQPGAGGGPRPGGP
jgi:hypothetical protein